MINLIDNTAYHENHFQCRGRRYDFCQKDGNPHLPPYPYKLSSLSLRLVNGVHSQPTVVADRFQSFLFQCLKIYKMLQHKDHDLLLQRLLVGSDLDFALSIFITLVLRLLLILDNVSTFPGCTLRLRLCLCC